MYLCWCPPGPIVPIGAVDDCKAGDHSLDYKTLDYKLMTEAEALSTLVT